MPRLDTTKTVVVRDEPAHDDDSLIDNWVQLAERYYPELAKPIVRAMAQRAKQGPYGETLRKIEEGMHGLNDSALPEMTGSELQMLAAILRQLKEETSQLLTHISGQWQNV
jgi:hypothetical protein